MGAIRLKQIDEALGYDAHMSAMVFNMEKKRVAQRIRQMPRDDYALIDAQKMMDANDAANAMQSMLNGKFGKLSIKTHHGVRIDSQQFVKQRKTYGRRIRLCQSITRSPHPSCRRTARPRCNKTSCDEPRSCCDPSALSRTV